MEAAQLSREPLRCNTISKQTTLAAIQPISSAVDGRRRLGVSKGCSTEGEAAAGQAGAGTEVEPGPGSGAADVAGAPLNGGMPVNGGGTLVGAALGAPGAGGAADCPSGNATVFGGGVANVMASNAATAAENASPPAAPSRVAPCGELGAAAVPKLPGLWRCWNAPSGSGGGTTPERPGWEDAAMGPAATGGGGGAERMPGAVSPLRNAAAGGGGGGAEPVLLDAGAGRELAVTGGGGGSAEPEPDGGALGGGGGTAERGALGGGGTAARDAVGGGGTAEPGAGTAEPGAPEAPLARAALRSPLGSVGGAFGAGAGPGMVRPAGGRTAVGTMGAERGPRVFVDASRLREGAA